MLLTHLSRTFGCRAFSNQIRSLGFENIILAGHSCGAWASISLAGQFPEKIKGTIATNPACRGKISDRLNDTWPAWDAFHEHYVNKFFIQPTEINSLLSSLMIEDFSLSSGWEKYGIQIRKYHHNLKKIVNMTDAKIEKDDF